MKTIKIWNDTPSDSQAQIAAQVLDDGQLIVWPTDTLYGLACDALNPKAIERICRQKGINPDKTNLSIVCQDISQASEYARIDDKGFRLLKELTPGPYTFIFKAASTLPKAFKSRKTVGIRIPDSVTALAITRALGRPVMTTSVAFDEDDYAVNPELIAEAHEGVIDLMVDAGDGSTEQSTVIDCSNGDPQLVRQGKGEVNL